MTSAAQEQRPSLRLARLRLRELKAIRSLNLPEDGLDWGDAIPDVVLIGGPNGSGKTVLLELIAHALEEVSRCTTSAVAYPSPQAALVAFDLFSLETDQLGLQALYREPPDVEAVLQMQLLLEAKQLTDTRHDVEIDTKSGELFRGGANPHGRPGWRMFSEIFAADDFISSSLPSLIHIPSVGRDLQIIHTHDKRPSKLPVHDQFVYRWSPRPAEWAETFEARLYAARWEDLNAKEEGRLEDARHFALYADAFAAFFPGKRLTWRKAELMVEVVDSGRTHGLDALSSGEKQLLVFLAELLLRWRPGSMILIDEPELHLHPSLQVRFFDALLQWREQRGGQLILATQSHDLFRHAPPGTKLLLGQS